MSTIITRNIRTFIANQFINGFNVINYNTWVTATSYSIGDIVVYGNYKYIATTAGTSGATPPTHTSGSASDGGVTWLYVETIAVTNYFENNMYVAIGNKDAWPSEPTPDTPLDDDESDYPNSAEIIAAKRLTGSSVSYAVVRHDWSSGMSVDQYDPTVESFGYTNPWYVYTDDDHIYKCLDNAGGTVSTSKPTGTSTTPFYTADGLLWQYMASVSASDAIQFLTSGYVPVEKKLSDDGSAQWDVQANAKKGSLSTINVTAGGSGYTTASVTIGTPPAGGTQATATAVLNGGVVTAIQLTNIGEGYTSTPSVSISGDGSSATAEAVMAPKDGNGSNILLELDARYVIVYARFDGTEGGYFPVTGENDFRRISLLVDPLDVNGDLASAARYIGPGHDDWDGSETSGKSELSAGSGTTLYFENIEPVVRATGQIEDIKISLKF